MILYGLVTVAISYMVAYTLVPVIGRMLVNANFVRPNYRGEEIPLGVGLVFPFTLLISGAVWVVLQPEMTKMTLVIMLSAVSMSFLGLIDDVLGSRNASGLKGHFRKLLFEGELTTGALKALGGGMIALLATLVLVPISKPVDFLLVVLNTLIIALSTNAINLLDLRPGRAIKGYLFLTAVIIAIGYQHPETWLLLFLTGAVFAYMPFDLKAQAMMGDTGSNVLGITVGIISVVALSLNLKLIYFLFLIVFHIYTEKYSLTTAIENNKLLKSLDMIGREKRP